ncbi:hypothetical protein [Pseudoalteromonas sp. Of7M-16]|nr:hypothetical protein [Pseudoalteromonas sp. Of7M-16]MCG7546813.1 hypothetical protein [Pseudoalteromonas sp. Of7M-16]
MNRVIFIISAWLYASVTHANTLSNLDSMYAITPEGTSSTVNLTLTNLNKPLIIYNGDAKRDMFHLKFSGSININSKIEVLGHPANLLITSANKVTCTNCNFENAKRISISSGSFYSNRIVASQSGQIDIKTLNARGAQSLELYTDNLITSSNTRVDINLKAMNHKNEYLIMDESGDIEVGTGGISLYLGGYSVNYSDGKITGPSLQMLPYNSRTYNATINGQYKSAGFSVATNKNLTIASNTNINTVTEALSSSNSDNGLFVPSEGIAISHIGKLSVGDPFNFEPRGVELQSAAIEDTQSWGHGRGFFVNPNIVNYGKLYSDENLKLVSLSRIINQGIIYSGAAEFISRSGVSNSGQVEATDIKVSGYYFTNQNNINARTLTIETQKDIANGYGGIIRANSLILKSREGTVANGTRRSGQNLTSTRPFLELTRDHENLSQGIYHNSQVQKIKEVSHSNLSAKIYANSIQVDAQAFENINSYNIPRGASDWSSGIKVSSARSNDVVFQAENKLEIKAPKYILNSSAILSLSQSGVFDINSNKVFNERYRLDVETGYYSGVSYTNDSKTGVISSEQGSRSKINHYSPPGRIIVFGKLRVSDGTHNARSTQEFNNMFSYTEVFSKAYFNNLQLSSIGLRLSKDTYTATYADTKYCQTTGRCRFEKIDTFVESETLLSFHGGVYGVKEDLPSSSDLNVTNLDALGTEKKNEGIKYMKTFEYNYGIGNTAIVSSQSTNGDILTFVVTTCRMVILPGDGEVLQPACSNQTHTVNLKTLVDQKNKDKDIDGTNYTARQIEDALNKRIQGYLNTPPPNTFGSHWLPTSIVLTGYEISADKKEVNYSYRKSGYSAIDDIGKPSVKDCETNNNTIGINCKFESEHVYTSVVLATLMK